MKALSTVSIAHPVEPLIIFIFFVDLCIIPVICLFFITQQTKYIYYSERLLRVNFSYSNIINAMA